MNEVPEILAKELDYEEHHNSATQAVADRDLLACNHVQITFG